MLYKIKKFHIHKLTDSGYSLGIHFSQTYKRVDIHVLNYIISIGKVYIHNFGNDRYFAVSDSFHAVMLKKQKIIYAEPTNDNILCER